MAHGDTFKIPSSEGFVDRYNMAETPRWIQRHDLRLERLEKALGTGEAGTILLQPDVDKVIAHLVEFKNPTRNNIPRKRGTGQAWIVNRRTAGSTPAGWVSDTDAAPEDNPSYAQVSFTYRTLLVEGRISRKLMATGASYINIMAEEMEAKAREFRDHEDSAMIIGDNAGTIFSADANQPDGYEVLITGNQVIHQSGTAVGGALTLAKIDETIDACSGNPDLIIASKRTRRNLNALLQANQRFVDTVEVAGGFITLSYQGIPVLTSTNSPDNLDTDGTNTTGSGGAGASQSSMIVLDTEFTWVGELSPISVQPTDSGTTQFDTFEIFEDVVNVINDTLRHSKLVGIDGL